MSFEIEGKVALITGGATGIGLRYAKELLRNGLKGVAIADVNEELAKKALKDIETEFGSNRAIFVKADVSNKQEFEDAFEKTIAELKNVDILINNAGILNDAAWEREIGININGTINGVLLGLENYLQKHRSGSEAVIVNISSIAGVREFPELPVYTATKFAIHGMTRAFGAKEHFERTKVRVIAMCPGLTKTRLLTDAPRKVIAEPYHAILLKRTNTLPVQTPEDVARGMVKIIKEAKTATVWIAEGGKDPYEFVLPERVNGS